MLGIIRPLLLCCALGLASSDVGYDLFFTTNLDEMANAPIEFDKPLPSWLVGSLIRNGIGRFEMGHRHVTTALDAYAKLSKFYFTGGNNTNIARFSTKFVMSDSYTKSVAAGDIQPYMMLGAVDPPFEPWQTLESMVLGADNMNVNVFNYGDGKGGNGYIISSDFWNVYEITANDLGTVGPVKPAVPGAPTYDKMIVLGSAHALPEYGTKDHITFVTLASVIPGTKSRYYVYRTNGVKERNLIADIEVDNASYMHSFGLSKKYMIIIGTPLFIDPLKIFRTLNPSDGFRWVPTEGTTFHVVDLGTGFVKSIQTENFFFLHHINSFEDENGNIVLDACTYKNGDALRMMDLKNLVNATMRSFFKQPLIKRYTINVKEGTVGVNTFPVNPDVPFAAKLDFPTINENYRYSKYCYVYGVVYAVYSPDFLDMALVKKDICTGKGDKFWYKKGSYFNEAFFVARPGASEEDDGILMVDILDTYTKTSTMTLVDAKTMKVSTSALLPTNNPFGTHGRFFPEVV